jgi:hypothetical protein
MIKRFFKVLFCIHDYRGAEGGSRLLRDWKFRKCSKCNYNQAGSYASGGRFYWLTRFVWQSSRRRWCCGSLGALRKLNLNFMRPYIMKKLLILVAISFVIGCSDADVASRNLSKAAEMFELERRIVFYNGITDAYILTVEGRCSIVDTGAKLSVTCKTGDSDYKKHHLGLSDNVTYFSEQLEPAGVDVYRYRVIFKPEAIIPNIDLETSS